MTDTHVPETELHEVSSADRTSPYPNLNGQSLQSQDPEVEVSISVGADEEEDSKREVMDTPSGPPPTAPQSVPTTSQHALIEDEHEMDNEHDMSPPMSRSRRLQTDPDVKGCAVRCMYDTWCGPCMLRVRMFNSLLYYYLWPLSLGIWYSLSCVVYHFLNFHFALGMFIFSVVVVSIAVPFLLLACSGIPILWIYAEITILFARLELAVSYYMVEDSPKFLAQSENVRLSVYTRYLPKFGRNLARFKFIFSNSQVYLYVFYYVFAKPLVTIFTSWAALPACYCGYWMATPIIYAAYPPYFTGKHRSFCFPGYSSENNNCKNDWKVDSGGDIFAVFLIGLVLMPFALAFSSFMAQMAKTATYYFLTDVYTRRTGSEDATSLLSKSSVASSKGGVTEDHIVDITGAQSQDSIQATNTYRD